MDVQLKVSYPFAQKGLQMKSSIVVFCIGFVGALIFDRLHLPMPWLLGPIFFVLCSQFFIKRELVWPAVMRNIGLIIVGIAIGQQFNLAIFGNMGTILPYLIGVNLALFAFAIVVSYGLHRLTKMPFKSALISSIPGGLSQFVTFAEEDRDINLAIVTYYHVVRVICVVLLIPFLITGEKLEIVSSPALITWQLVWLFALSVAASWLGEKFKLPVAQFLGPVIAVICIQFTGVTVEPVPFPVLYLAQIFIGAYIGLLLKPHMFKLPRIIFIGGIISTFLLIAFSFATSLLLQRAFNYSYETSFLSTAPGGLDQMGLLAAGVGADISVVTTYQLFRILFIFLIILPILRKWLLRKEANTK